MSQSSRYLAFVGYLLSLPGALFVLLARPDEPFAVYHARQSLRLAIIGIAAPLIWAVIAWILAWIPVIGGMLAVILFALVIATYVGIIISWIAGMIYSLRGQVRPSRYLWRSGSAYEIRSPRAGWPGWESRPIA